MNRYVGDDEVGIDGDRAGQPDALALAAGELVRVAADRIGRKAHRLQKIAHAPCSLAAIREAVSADRLGDDPPHAVPGIQRGEWILEDHLHAPTERAELGLTEVRDVLAVEEDPASGRLVEPEDGAADRRFPAAGFAHQSERLAATDGQRDVIHRADIANVPVEQDAAPDRKIDLEVLELDEATLERGHPVAASRVRSHSSAGTGLKHATLWPRSTSTSGGTSCRDNSTS
jgi:hypothetical protein